MNADSSLSQALIYLLSAVVCVPLIKKLGMGSVLGYLIAGILIGPYSFGFIRDTEAVLHFSEFGVVIFLFLIGLELNPKRLWALRNRLAFLGGSQMLATSLALMIGLRLLFSELSWLHAFLLGFVLSLSSTALVLAILREKHYQKTLWGESAFSVLLFQDLAIIPLLAAVPFLGTSSEAGGGQLSWFLILIPVFFLLLRYVLKFSFRLIAQLGLREVFTAAALLTVLGTAALFQSMGISMALGASLAGLLLADSGYRHEIEINLEPFKGLLMGLFFIAIGMSLDLSLFREKFVWGLFLLIAFAGIKYGVVRGISYFSPLKPKLVKREGTLLSLFLSQGGEFTFVFSTIAAQYALFPTATLSMLNTFVATSMVLTPLLLVVDEQWQAFRTRRKFAETSSAKPFDHPEYEKDQNHVIVAGFGRFGQIIGRLLHAEGIPTVLLDKDPGQVDLVRKFGWKAFYGDATRMNLLESAGIESARALVFAVDDTQSVLEILPELKRKCPHLKIFVRARNREDAFQFFNAGYRAYRETFGSSLDVAEDLFRSLGYGGFEAHNLIHRFKQYDQSWFEKTAKHASDDTLMRNLAQQYREDLARILGRETGKNISSKGDEGWVSV